MINLKNADVEFFYYERLMRLSFERIKNVKRKLQDEIRLFVRKYELDDKGVVYCFPWTVNDDNREEFLASIKKRFHMMQANMRQITSVYYKKLSEKETD